MPDDATTTTSEPAAESTPAPADTGTPVDSTSAAPDSATTQPPTGAPAEQPGSSTTEQQPSNPNAAQPSTGAQAQPPVDWQKRYSDLQSYADRRQRDFQQKFTGIQKELEEHKKFRTEFEAKQNQKPWQKPGFEQVVGRAQAVHRQLQAAEKLPAEVRDHAKQAILAGMSPEDQAQYEDYRNSMQDFQREFFTDPKKTMAPLIEEVAKEIFQRQQAEVTGRQQVDQDFSQPHVHAILEKEQYRGYFQKQIDSGVPYPAAMEMLKLRAAFDIASAKLGTAGRMQDHVQEQQRLVKGRASQTIAPNTAATQVDAYEVAKTEAQKRGIPIGSSQFNRLLDKIQAANAAIKR